MEIKAVSRYVRISPQKVRKLIGAVKGKPVEDGMNVLKFMPQKAAGIVNKVVKSAVSNADHNNGIDVDTLVIKSQKSHLIIKIQKMALCLLKFMMIS